MASSTNQPSSDNERASDASPQVGSYPTVSCSPAESCWTWMVLVFGILSGLFVLDQLCLGISNKWMPEAAAVYLTYIALGFVIASLITFHVFHHDKMVHESRLEDCNVVQAMFVEAKTIEPRLENPQKPDAYEDKKRDLHAEVGRLEKIGEKEWTEYQVLSLSQMLVDFLRIEDLKATSRLRLDHLKEYALGDAWAYKRSTYEPWEQRVNDEIEKLDDASDKESAAAVDEATEPLRAELRTLMEHIAGYESNWSEGQMMIRALMTVGAISIPLLLIMALLPLLHPESLTTMGILNWGLLGIIGSISMVLLDLQQSDLVEVGNTEGKQELWRSILGGALGFLAGVLAYATIAVGVVTDGLIVPDLNSDNLEDIGKAILVAVASGSAFEKIILGTRDTMGGRITDGNN